MEIRYRKRLPYLAIGMFWLVAVLLAATAAWWLGGLGLRSVPGLYAVSTESMRPGLAPGDYIVTSRDHYADRGPERGDIVVFKLPKDNRTDSLKRVVGLPGERVQVKAGVLHIDGAPVGRDKVGLREAPGLGDQTERFFEYVETLPNGRRYPIWERGDEEPYDDTREFVVPAGFYFLLGDNRDRSLDSRAVSEFGLVPRANLRDHPVAVVWSRDRRRIWTAVQAAP